MRSKLKSSIFYLLSVYAWYIVVVLADHYFPHVQAFTSVLIWFVPFTLILFVLCYRSFYESLWQSLLLSVFASLASIGTFLLAFVFAPQAWNTFIWFLNIDFLVLLALPVPFCYTVWYIDRYIGNRRNTNG